MNMTPEQIARARADGPKEPPKLSPMRDGPLFESKPWHPYAQAGLLLLALPVLAPSLLWLWITSKRWGRVSTVLVAVPAFIILASCIPYPRYAVIAITANVAMAVLYIWRYRRMEEGVVLGYSNLVAMAIIVGGALFMVGSCMTVPSSYFRASRGQITPTKTNVRAIVDDQIARPKRVVLPAAHVDWSHRIVRTEGGFTRDSARGIETWAPIDGGKYRLWFAVPGTPGDAPSDVEGTLMQSSREERDGIARIAGRDPGATDPMGRYAELVVVNASADEIARRLGREDPKEEMRWEWSWLIAIGFVIVGLGIVRSISEA
jgi:hypothetical protein